MKTSNKKVSSIIKKILLTIFIITFSQGLFSQSPGNTGTAMNLWLKANVGMSCTTSGCSISQWTDQSGNDNHAVQSSSSIQPSYTIASCNYNPGIYSDANTAVGLKDYLVLPDNTLPLGNSSYTVFIVVNNVTSGGPFLCGGANSYKNVNRFAVNPDGSTKNSWNLSSYDLDTPTNSSLSGNRTIYCVNYDGASRTAYISGENAGTNTTTNMNFTGINNRIGTRGNGGGIFTGEINEILVYPSSMSTGEMGKVSSYLAVKYGITLYDYTNSTGIDYVSSAGNNIWDATFMSNFNNDIIGIGYDPNEDLLQLQSHTIDDTTRIYVGDIYNSNLENPNQFYRDRSYKLIGHDKGKMCATANSNIEVPTSCGITSRIEREWKIQKRRGSNQQTFCLDFKLGACADLNQISVSDLMLLIDEDDNFSNGGTSCYSNGDASGIVISYNNPILTISNIPDSLITSNSNGTRFLTIGSVSGSTLLPISLTKFTVTPIDDLFAKLEWVTNSEFNNDYFLIQKSFNGSDWMDLGTLNGAGNSAIVQEYSFEDYNIQRGLSYYRLKQFDFNGQNTFSEIRTLNFITQNKIRTYPNPVNGHLTVIGPNISGSEIKIFNTIGQDVSKSIVFKKVSESEIIVNTESLANGVYIFVTNTTQQKIIIKH